MPKPVREAEPERDRESMLEPRRPAKPGKDAERLGSYVV
jgi:hypothetical protein